MNAKKAKLLRKFAISLAKNLETSYNIIDNYGGARHKQVFIDKDSFRSVVKKLKNSFKESKRNDNAKLS